MREILIIASVALLALADLADAQQSATAKYQAAVAAGVQPNADKAGKLVARTYDGPFKLWYGNDQYVGHGFGVVGLPASGQPDRAVWIAKFGQYNNLKGYWVFLPNANKCWQAVNVNGPLRYWNEDGRARGNPEDWELFVFKPVDISKGVVKVANIYGRHVQYRGGAFTADASENDGALFIIE